MPTNQEYPPQFLQILVDALHAQQPERFAQTKYTLIQEAEPFFINGQDFNTIDFSPFAIDWCCFRNCTFTNVRLGPRHFMQVGFVDCLFTGVDFRDVRAGFDFIRCSFANVSYNDQTTLGPTDTSLGSVMLDCSGDKALLALASAQGVIFEGEQEQILRAYDMSQNVAFRTK